MIVMHEDEGRLLNLKKYIEYNTSIDCATLTADDRLNCCPSVLYRVSNRSISSGENWPFSEYNPTHRWRPS